MTQSFSVNFEITDRNLAAFWWIIKQINVNIEVFPQFSGGLKAETLCFSGVGSVGMFIFRFLFSFYQEVAVRLTDRDGAKLVVLWTPLHALQGLFFSHLYVCSLHFQIHVTPLTASAYYENSDFHKENMKMLFS